MGIGCGLGLEAYRRFRAYSSGRPTEAGDPGRSGEPNRSGEPADPPHQTVYDPALLDRFGIDFRRVSLESEARVLSAGAPGAADVGGPGPDRLGPHALVARAPCPGPFGQCVERVGFEPFLAMLGGAGPSLEAIALVGEAAEVVASGYRRLLGQVGPYVDLVEFGDDYAYAGGPFFAPATFDAVFAPAVAMIIGVIRELAPGAKVLFHSCGAVLDLMPALVAAGIDILSPLDPSGKGMTPEVIADVARRLRTQRGERLILHGGLAPGVLTESEKTVRRAVRRLVRALGRDGGYILAPAGDVLEDVPPEKLETFFRLAREEGKS